MKQIEELYKEIRTFCCGVYFTKEEEEYIKKTLEQAYLYGVSDTLMKQLKKKENQK